MANRRARSLNYPWHIPESCKSVRQLAVKGDFRAAVSELERLAALGSNDARSALAYLYMRGTKLTAQNFARAEQLALLAAEKGNAYGAYVLGWVALLNAKDAASAINWWNRAADSGFSPGAIELARFLATDLPGKPPQIADALKAFSRARSLGHKAAKLLSNRLAAEGKRGLLRAIFARMRNPYLALGFGARSRIDSFGMNTFMHYPNASLDLFSTS